MQLKYLNFCHKDQTIFAFTKSSSKFVTHYPDEMLSSLITSQTRIKLLRKFFLNSSTKAYLRGLESEFGESSNGIRIELNRFEDAGLLTSYREGNKKVYKANCDHPLFSDIHNIIMKETGIDQVIEKVIHRIGKLFSVYLTGDFARGKDSPVIDLILVGDDIDREYLARKVVQAEELVGRKVKYTLIDSMDANEQLINFKPAELLPLWNNGDGKEVIK
jgi:DNA-binding transcriptional ArsR family regulator